MMGRDRTLDLIGGLRLLFLFCLLVLFALGYEVGGLNDNDEDEYGACLVFVLCFVCVKNGDRFGDSWFCLGP
jgi:hypothetical protein